VSQNVVVGGSILHLKSSLQNVEHIKKTIVLEQCGEPEEAAKVVGFLVCGFSLYA
jgi:hypothetical protein